MKIIATIFLFFVSTEILYSCKKHGNPIPVGVSVKENNVSWSAANYGASRSTATTSSGGTVTFLTVYGYDSLSNGIFQDILLTFQYPIVPQSYSLNFANVSALYRSNLFIVRPGGTINVTQISLGNIQGTFNLTSDTLTITGTFNVPIQ